ncbi:unnamed protein product [Mytilus coruscus]|uniref:Uncharacterized protein n=1 Tax=Mytilus coruscus TaxID=42192 RepID=A0A6J8AU17_MYTCO|nr:unnamed protein product [Mytilus coruscus]
MFISAYSYLKADDDPGTRQEENKEVRKRKCAHKRAIELSSMMTEDKRPNTEVDDTSKQIYAGYKGKHSSFANTLKDIDALQLILNQKDKHLQTVHAEKCLLQDRLNKQITSLLAEIKEKDNMIQQLCNKIEKCNKFHEVKKKKTLDGLTEKLDTVIGEISGLCSAINELLVEVRRKSRLSDTKNITLNIKQKGIMQISTED